MGQKAGVLIGRRVRHGRWMLGMTRVELAGLIGTGPEEVRALEADADRASAATLRAVAEVLGLPAEALVREGQRAPRPWTDARARLRGPVEVGSRGMAAQRPAPMPRERCKGGEARARRMAPAAEDVTAAIAGGIAVIRRVLGGANEIGAPAGSPAHQPLS